MTNQELAKLLVELLGGKENVVKASNCMTRMRVDIKDPSLVKGDEIADTEGVLGFVDNGTSLQIVLGPGTAKKVTDIAVEEYKLPRVAEETGEWEETKSDIKSQQKQGPLRRAMQTIADIFIPLIPAIIASGLFNGLASLLSTLIAQGTLAPDGFWYVVQLLFSLIGNAFMGYFAIYTGINAAKQFGATEGLGGMLGAISIGANINELSTYFGMYDAETPLNSILTTGKGGIIGVIIGVWILAKIEKAIRKRVPDTLDLVVTPFLTMLITGIIYVFVIMPVAGVISDLLVSFLGIFIGSEYRIVNIISGYILAALFLPMVLLGLHHGLIPIYAIQLETQGGVSLFPVLAMAGAGQVGAAIAIYRKAKRVGNTKIQKAAAGGLPAGFLGVGEPLIYGVTLPLGKPFLTAGLGAGFGGAWVMARNVMANSWGPSGLVAIAIMKPECMLDYFIGLVISYIAGFIITNLAVKDEAIAKAV